MRDEPCVTFLRWALPHMGLRWEGFRRVRRQVCRRVLRRAGEVGAADFASYQAYLQEHPNEWGMLVRCCRVTISRFYRDRGVWSSLETEVLPRLAAGARRAGRGTLRVWSAGCASGEEPYTLALVWALGAVSRASLRLEVLATDVDERVLERARRAVYPESSLGDLPPAWRQRAFVGIDGGRRLRATFRSHVRFVQHDVRDPPPDGAYDLVLCRNLVFTYFDYELQAAVAASFANALRPGGALVLGAHERLPAGVEGFEPWVPCVLRRCG